MRNFDLGRDQSEAWDVPDRQCLTFAELIPDFAKRPIALFYIHKSDLLHFLPYTPIGSTRYPSLGHGHVLFEPSGLLECVTTVAAIGPFECYVMFTSGLCLTSNGYLQTVKR